MVLLLVALLGGAVFLLPKTASAAYNTPKLFVTGDESHRLAYVAGLYDSFELINLLGDGIPYDWLVFCVDRHKMTNGQMEARLRNYLLHHKDEWDKNLPFLYLRMMRQYCQ